MLLSRNSIQFRLLFKGGVICRSQLACRYVASTRIKMEESKPDLRSWEAPSKENKYLTGLNIRNSLAPGEKVEFVPEKGRQVTWYCCGPTVYDTAHLGHARTYVACDTIRSILERYFNYDVKLVINVTDIDDKIIQRANSEGAKFQEIASHWEREFWNDMAALGVDTPNFITRVSEYLPEIIAYIEKIIENGYAYVSEGSVYFDIEAYRSSNKHVYAKLEPSSFNDLNLMTDGEGTLGEVSTQKKSQYDFALWKKAKPDEPFWQSPWGNGRPGWHIECSAMCASIFGKDTIIDIHSGGVDLKFPHHDNEIAQSEAYSDRNRWVNYFIHFGHLHIQGLKMSKSLKNFISIKELLNKYNKRQLRIFFLSSKYDGTLNYNHGPQGMAEAVAIDDTLFHFFSLINSRIDQSYNSQKIGEHDLKLEEAFAKLKYTVHAAFLDNFDTPRVLQAICSFVGMLNSYLSTPHAQLRHAQGMSFKKYLYKILEVLKIHEPGMEYGMEKSSGPSISGPLLEHLISLRGKARRFAQDSMKWKDADMNKVMDLMKACDRIRDEHLPELGVLLEDRDDGESVVKYKSKDEQLKELQRKEELKQQRLQEEKEKKNLKNTRPEDFIAKKYPGKFSKFDENYLPTHLSNGTPVSKSERQSLSKLLEKHMKLYEKNRG